MKFIRFAAIFFLMPVAHAENNLKTLKTCNLGGSHEARLEGKAFSLKGDKKYEQLHFYIRVDGNLEKAFKDDDIASDVLQNEDTVRSLEFKKCKNHILIFSVAWGNSHANMAIRFNNTKKQIETMDFSSKGIPKYSYANDEEWFMVTPSEIPYRSPVLYYAQHYGSKESRSLHSLPSTKGYEVTEFYSASPN